MSPMLEGAGIARVISARLTDTGANTDPKFSVVLAYHETSRTPVTGLRLMPPAGASVRR